MTPNGFLLAIYLVKIILEIALPVFLAVYLMKRYESSWIMVGTGVLTGAVALLLFTLGLDQIKLLFQNGTLKAPATALVPYVNAGIVGFLAAIIEEGFRWIGFRLTEKYGKPFRSALGLGVGHGGIQLILLGAITTAIPLFSNLFYLPGHDIAKGISPVTVQATIANIQTYWAAAWYGGVMNIVTDVAQFAAQIVFSIMIWKAITTDSPIWFLAALVYHTVFAGIATFLSNLGWSYWQIEGILALFFLLNIMLIYNYWSEEGGLESEGDEDEDDEEEEEEEEDEDEDEEDEPKSKKSTRSPVSKTTRATAVKSKKPAPAKKKPITAASKRPDFSKPKKTVKK